MELFCLLCVILHQHFRHWSRHTKILTQLPDYTEYSSDETEYKSCSVRGKQVEKMQNQLPSLCSTEEYESSARFLWYWHREIFDTILLVCFFFFFFFFFCYLGFFFINSLIFCYFLFFLLYFPLYSYSSNPSALSRVWHKVSFKWSTACFIQSFHFLLTGWDHFFLLQYVVFSIICLFDFLNNLNASSALWQCSLFAYFLSFFLFCYFVCLMVYQPSWNIWCQIYPTRRTVEVLFNP